MTWTGGLSFDSFESRDQDFDKILPKAGVQWNLTDWARVRGAYFQTVKRVLVVDSTIEPTQVAGFNQFFDDTDGAETTRYGVGLDTILPINLYAGAEYSIRDLTIKVFSSAAGSKTLNFDRREDFLRAYTYWTPHRHIAFSAEFQFERVKFSGEEATPGLSAGPASTLSVTRMNTWTFPLAARYFHPSGFFAGVRGTYVRQELDLLPTSTLTRNSDEFYLVDATMGFRLPKNRNNENSSAEIKANSNLLIYLNNPISVF